jgi:ribose transport system permease protein
MEHSHQGTLAGLLVGLAVGAAAGLLNGVLVAYFGVNAVIATLATFSAYTGIAFLATGGQQVGVSNSFLNTLGTGKFAGIPLTLLVLIAVALIGMAAMRYTDIGRRVYAVGGSARAARLSGVRVERYTLAVFVVSGLCAAIAGILLTAQTGAGQPGQGTAGLELTAITAVLLGGIGLTGGSGSVLGALLGVALLATLDNGLILIGLQAFWQQVATGVLLVAAVTLQNYKLISSRVAGILARGRATA